MTIQNCLFDAELATNTKRATNITGVRNRTAECPVRILVANLPGTSAPKRRSADPVGRSRHDSTQYLAQRARHK